MKNILGVIVAMLGLLCIAPPVFGQTDEVTPAASPAASKFEMSAPGEKRAREFQGDDLGQVLRLLARQAKISLVVDEAIKGNLNLRLENSSAMDAIEIIAHANRLILTKDDKGAYYLSPPDTAAETLDFLARPETANHIAAYKHHLYAALIQQGFTPDESLKIVLSSSASEFVPMFVGKTGAALPR